MGTWYPHTRSNRDTRLSVPETPRATPHQVRVNLKCHIHLQHPRAGAGGDLLPGERGVLPQWQPARPTAGAAAGNQTPRIHFSPRAEALDEAL